MQTMATRGKRKKIVLTLEQKLAVIERYENGESAQSLALSHKIGVQTVRDIIKQKDKIQMFINQCNASMGSGKRKSMKLSTFEGLDSCMLAWYNQKRNAGVTVTTAMSMEYAKYLYKYLGLSGPFNASVGWLHRFKQRYGITKNHTPIGEPQGNADEFQGEFQHLMTTENWLPDQIYIAMETTLYWKSVPSQKIDANAKKPSNERVTVLCCVNATGTHKLKLALFGKSKQPRALKGLPMETLPVHYYDGKGSWMSETILQSWFDNRWVAEVSEFQIATGVKPRAMLLLDAAHFRFDETLLTSGDGSLVAKFLPANAGRLVQPLQQGIISSLKSNYRMELQKALDGADDDDGYVKYWTFLDAVHGIANSWIDVTPATITESWNLMLNPPEREASVSYEITLKQSQICCKTESKEDLPQEAVQDSMEEWLESNDDCTHMESDAGVNYSQAKDDTDHDLSDEESHEKEIEPSTALTSVETLLGFVDRKMLSFEQQISLKKIRTDVRNLLKSIKRQPKS